MKTEETSLAAWKIAIKNRKLFSVLIFQSDQGTQYACEKFSNTLDSYKIVTRGISKKGGCWDNAVPESFFKNFNFGTNVCKQIGIQG